MGNKETLKPEDEICPSCASLLGFVDENKYCPKCGNSEKQKALPCKKCSSTDITPHDCGYNTFNPTWAKCNGCGYEVKTGYGESHRDKHIINEWNEDQSSLDMEELIEWVEGQKKDMSFTTGLGDSLNHREGHNTALDAVIEKLRGGA